MNDKRNRMLKAVIVDDDPMVHLYLDLVFRKNFEFLDLVGQAFGIKEGVELIERERPDIVFTDIEMPDGTGFDLINSFPVSSFAYVMFSSEYDYAWRVSQSSALSFLRKPLRIKELRQCVGVFYESLPQ